MDVKIVVTRFGIFAFVYTFVLGIPFAIGLWGRPYLEALWYHWWMVPLGVGILLSSLSPFMYLKLQRQVEKGLRRQEFHEQEWLRKLSERMMGILDPRILLGLIVRQLVRILKVSYAAVYLLREDGSFSLRDSFGKVPTPFLPDMITADWGICREIEQKRPFVDRH